VRADSRFVNIRKVSPDSDLEDVRIYEFDDQMHLRSISEADTGKHVRGNTWQLSGVQRTEFTAEGAQVEKLGTIEWNTVITPDMLAVLLVRPEKMSAWALFQYTRHLAKNHQRTERYEIAMWKKIVYPFAALVMMGLALPFAYILVRAGGVGAKLFAGIMLGVLFHFLNTLFSHLGVLQGWPPFVSATLPSAIFLLIAMGMMWSVERR
jgi:lipopolysaccharide export system permease protein